ncbi:exosortase N [Flavobacterium hungaricum]|uniref:Exosortase N n=1 Tax=Flavobacterium hungaricum TaxID=2082725 RepID=A0ABR9TLI3_9FLAO|nr:exosortase N [Flavobacterium hungaricum]MBE8725899.1 exosortase N [Flavobacterium hungaricum]
MKDFILKNKSILLGLSAILLLFIINYKILIISANHDFFGIVVSLGLFIIGGRKTNFKINYLVFTLLLLFEFVSYRLLTKSVHFLALLLFLCLVFHYFTQKFSFIAFICLLLFSTLFNTFFIHLTTEIKQNLCYVVYLTLKNFIVVDKIEGVNFYINQSKITIDTACMGLSMFKTGLLSSAILMTLEEKKQKRNYTIGSIILFCSLTVLLNLIANYFRIITLIFFDCTQENTLHHSIGLICFVIYQILPMLLLIRFIKPKIEGQNEIVKPSKNILVLIAFVVVLAVSIKMKNEDVNEPVIKIPEKYEHTNGSWVNNEVYKINTDQKLIYIKTPSHNPLVCWTGNGYNIIETKKILNDKDEIWFNKMEKNKQLYYSSWWYECNGKKYTSFIEVMFLKLFYNSPIVLINETYKPNLNKKT